MNKASQTTPPPPPVTAATRHAVYPELNHDERARLNFLAAAYRVIANEITPGNQAIYDRQVLPKFKQKNGRAPKSRHEVKASMDNDPLHSLWGATRRNLMEIRQQTGRAIVLKQLASLAEKSEKLNAGQASLQLDPSLEIPSYVSQVDHHCMPGSYYTELIDGDVAPAANYDTGFFITTGGTIGPLCDGAGQAVAQWLRNQGPDFLPKRILDIGVAAGHSLVPIAMAFPESEIIAVDVSAPMLRYAHARARSLGVNNIQFIQANGENLEQFASEGFDLVMTSIFLHELSAKALPKILSECYRLTRQGGITLHLEQPQYSEEMPLFEQFMRDWDAYNNNEPFWSAMHGTDLYEELARAGFDRQKVFSADVATLRNESEKSLESNQEDYGRSPVWHAYGAKK